MFKNENLKISTKFHLNEDSILNEGTDYKGKAIKMIVDSGLFNEQVATEIINALFRQDIHAFVHAPAWTEKYLKGIARMLIEECNGDSSKAKPFLEESPQFFNTYIEYVKENREKLETSVDDEFVNKLSYSDLKKKVEEIEESRNKQSQDELSKMAFSNSGSYSLVPIDSYSELHSKYGGSATGDGTDEEGQYAGRGGTSWCHTNSKTTYDNWVSRGEKFFILQNNNWKNIPFNKKTNKEKYGKDDYGNSLIALLVNKHGLLKNATLRCNHVGISGSADNQYKTYAELSRIAGFNVEEEVLKHLDHIEPINVENAFIIRDGTLFGKYDDDEFDYSTITSYTIPNGVTRLGDNVFLSCTGLTSVTIPDSVMFIGKSAFDSCTGLTSITISNSVTTIGKSAFEGCESLTSITIPDSMTYIAPSMFSNCRRLIDITIPNSVMTIGDYAFQNCKSLTEITIPDSVTSIEEDAFYNCDSLKDVYYKGTEEQWNKIDIVEDDNGYLLKANIHFKSSKNEGLNMNRKFILKEDVEMNTEINYNVGVASMLNNLIIDEMQAIDGYNNAITSLKALKEVNDIDFDNIINVLEDINAEEHVHVGQLQEALKVVSPDAEKFEDGEKEGAKQLEESNKENLKEYIDGAIYTPGYGWEPREVPDPEEITADYTLTFNYTDLPIIISENSTDFGFPNKDIEDQYFTDDDGYYDSKSGTYIDEISYKDIVIADFDEINSSLSEVIWEAIEKAKLKDGTYKMSGKIEVPVGIEGIYDLSTDDYTEIDTSSLENSVGNAKVVKDLTFKPLEENMSKKNIQVMRSLRKVK